MGALEIKAGVSFRPVERFKALGRLCAVTGNDTVRAISGDTGFVFSEALGDLKWFDWLKKYLHETLINLL